MATKQQSDYSVESVTYSSRETELTWVIHFPVESVWDAVNQASNRAGLTPILVDKSIGMTITKPPFSLFNLGRRIALSFSGLADGSTRVRATYLHGMLTLQGQGARLQMLEGLLLAGVMILRDKARKEQTSEAPAKVKAQPKATPPPAATPKEEQVPPTASNQQSQPPTQQDAASKVPPPRAQETSPPLEAMDFRGANWDELPLTPPKGKQAHHYMSRPLAERKRSIGSRLLWFSIGLVIVATLMLLSGVLEPLLTK